jgi:hypothetical protein
MAAKDRAIPIPSPLCSSHDSPHQLCLVSTGGLATGYFLQRNLSRVRL